MILAGYSAPGCSGTRPGCLYGVAGTSLLPGRVSLTLVPKGNKTGQHRPVACANSMHHVRSDALSGISGILRCGRLHGSRACTSSKVSTCPRAYLGSQAQPTSTPQASRAYHSSDRSRLSEEELLHLGQSFVQCWFKGFAEGPGRVETGLSSICSPDVLLEADGIRLWEDVQVAHE